MILLRPDWMEPGFSFCMLLIPRLELGQNHSQLI
jgi:hypothetical protein